jgi:hypothetical protein
MKGGFAATKSEALHAPEHDGWRKPGKVEALAEGIRTLDRRMAADY